MSAETITRVNGNGRPYTVGLPKIVIQGHMNDVALAHITENTGLVFVVGSWGNLEAQPTESKQIVALMMTYNFKSRYFNNSDANNTIFLKSDHHVGFQVDSICFDCVKHNRIVTNGLSEDSRLSC